MTEPRNAQPETPSPGAIRRLDRYELVSQIARGGMGTVYLARMGGAGGFQRLFAIKLMHPHLAEETEFINMLLDEARLAARIHHPNAVAIVDVCASGEGYYLVMDYIDGFTLGRVLGAPGLAPRDRSRVGVRVLLDALGGLGAAHDLTDDEGVALGLVHRDVSPQNILVGLDGVSRITDFGIALAASRIAASRPGMVKGKPSYMAPEQVSGEAVDRRADVFAIGIMLWEALTQRRLFKADSDAAALMKVLNDPIPAPSAYAPAEAPVPPALDAVCLRALERDREKRFATARDMAEALERAATEAGLLAPPHDVAERLRTTFATEIAERRALLRAHNRTVTTGSVPILNVDAMGVPRATSGDSQSLSIPAVSLVPPAKSSSPAPGTRRAGLHPAWMAVGAGVLLAGGLAVAHFVARSDARSYAPGTASPVHTAARPETSEPTTVPTLPAPTVVVVAPPVQPPLVPPVVPLVVPPVQPAVATPIAPEAATSPRRHGGPRRDEGTAPARTQADAGARAATPSAPTIETNPYLGH